MIKPTVGRVVWFYEKFVPDTNQQPQAAVIAYVHSDRCVNLSVIDQNGISSGRTSVTLRQPEDVAPSWAFCEWMPFQVFQAQKIEAEGGL